MVFKNVFNIAQLFIFGLLIRRSFVKADESFSVLFFFLFLCLVYICRNVLSPVREIQISSSTVFFQRKDAQDVSRQVCRHRQNTGGGKTHMNIKLQVLQNHSNEKKNSNHVCCICKNSDLFFYLVCVCNTHTGVSERNNKKIKNPTQRKRCSHPVSSVQEDFSAVTPGQRALVTGRDTFPIVS